jgi:hypothetical protein
VCACARACVRVRGCSAAWARVALLIKHEMGMCHIVICGLAGSTSFFRLIGGLICGGGGGGDLLNIEFVF